MKRIRPAFAYLGLLLLVLGGCGSSASPPFSVSCAVQKLQPRLCGVAVACVRANVTVRNTTDTIGQAVIYGPPFALVHHIWPPWRLRPINVVLQLPHAQQTFLGFVVLSIGPHRAAYLILRFEPLRHPASIVVATKAFVRAKDRSVLQNPQCVIRRLQ